MSQWIYTLCYARSFPALSDLLITLRFPDYRPYFKPSEAPARIRSLSDGGGPLHLLRICGADRLGNARYKSLSDDGIHSDERLRRIENMVHLPRCVGMVG